MAGKTAKDQAWAEAARRCRLSSAEVRMAKELGFKPRTLLKNIPNKAEWKAPVTEWVRDLYAKRQHRQIAYLRHRTRHAPQASVASCGGFLHGRPGAGPVR